MRHGSDNGRRRRDSVARTCHSGMRLSRNPRIRVPSVELPPSAGVTMAGACVTVWQRPVNSGMRLSRNPCVPSVDSTSQE